MDKMKTHKVTAVNQKLSFTLFHACAQVKVRALTHTHTHSLTSVFTTADSNLYHNLDLLF